jgi:hypothetical protein
VSGSRNNKKPFVYENNNSQQTQTNGNRNSQSLGPGNRKVRQSPTSDNQQKRSQVRTVPENSPEESGRTF